MLQMKRSANSVKHIAEREIDICPLRIELDCHILRGSRHAESREKRNRSQQRMPHRISLNRLGISFHPVRQSVNPIPG